MNFLRRYALSALLVLPLLTLNGCFGGRSNTPEEPRQSVEERADIPVSEPAPIQEPAAPPKPVETPASAPAPAPIVPEPVKPEPAKPEPVEPEAPKPEVPAPQPEPPAAPVVEPAAVPKEPVPAEKETPQTEPKPGVNSQSPVNSRSPVKQGSPVNTQSPVKQDPPVRQPQPFGFRAPPPAVALLASAVLAEETPSVSVPEPQGERTSGRGERRGAPPAEEPLLPIPAPGSGDTEMAVSGGTAPGSDVAEEPAVPPGEKRLRFNFRGVPWKDVIDWFAEQADLSLQADLVPQGTLNLTDNRYYTPIEALDILNSYLLFKEFTIIRKGKSLFVIFLPDGIPPNLLEPIAPSELDDRGKYEICRCVFTLVRTPPDIIQNEVDKLLGPQGSLVSLPKSQQLVITETAGTLRTIRDIIQRIDDPTGLDSPSLIQIIELGNVSADEALGIMRRLLAIDESDQSLRTAVDVTGKKIWITGRPDMVERAKEVINTIETSFPSMAPDGQAQFEIYDTGVADPATVLAVLQTLLVGMPEVRLSLDPRTNGIALLGRPANHATVKETIKQMQLSSSPIVDVIKLKHLSPNSAVELVKRFFATATADSSSTTRTTGVAPPTVEPDIAARQIIVRGTMTQIAEVRAFLQKLGEDGTGGRTAGATIRQIPLSQAAAAHVLDQIKDNWSKLGDNEIKIVVPSAIVPMRTTDELRTPTVPVPPNNTQIDETLDEIFGPTTLHLPEPVRYRTVQHTVMQPVYQPILTEQREEEDEIAQLKRQIAELTRMIEVLATTAPQPVAPTPEPISSPSAPVVVSAGPGGLMISSEDPEALDKLEDLIRMLSDETVLGKTTFAVYYLKNSTAEVVAQTLQALMGTARASASSISGTGTVNTSAVFDDEAQAALFGLMAFGQSIESTGPVSVTAEPRLNALMVQANPVDHKTIEKLLPILDQAEIPGGDPKQRATARLIELKNVRAEDVMRDVERIYASRMQSGNTGGSGRGNQGGNQQGRGQGQQGQQQPQMPQMMAALPGMLQGGGGPQAIMQAMMGQMGQAMGGRQQAGRANLREAEATMTLGVDTRSNSLIVYAPEALFLEVEQYVKALDERAGAVQSEMVIEYRPLGGISPALAQQTLQNMYGNEAIQFSRTTAPQGGAARGGFGGGGNIGVGGTGLGGAGVGFGGQGIGGNIGIGGNRGTGFGGGAVNPAMRGANPFGTGAGGVRPGGAFGGR